MSPVMISRGARRLACIASTGVPGWCRRTLGARGAPLRLRNVSIRPSRAAKVAEPSVSLHASMQTLASKQAPPAAAAHLAFCGISRQLGVCFTVQRTATLLRVPPERYLTSATHRELKNTSSQNHTKKKQPARHRKKKAPCPASPGYESPSIRRRASTRCTG